ncbi:MAG: hypothetical protein IJH38_06240 [Clostridia bacterium]|nr:hypothetical protein [Clostridia bacterium]
MTVNGFTLRPISSIEAGKLPEGAVLIVSKSWHDQKTWAVTKTEYYRARVKYHKTVAGPEAALHSEPDYDWPSIPTWQQGWIYVSGLSIGLGAWTIEGSDTIWTEYEKKS